MSREKELTKNTLLITIGRVSTQLVAFLLLPLYTLLLSTKEYGVVDLVTTIVQLLIPLTSLMIDQAVFRYLLNSKIENDATVVISTSFFTIMGINSICFLVYILVSSFIEFEYQFWIILILFSTAINNLFLQIARGIKKTDIYAIGTFVSSSVTICLNVICIALLKMRVNGMLLATFCGCSAGVIFIFLKLNLRKYISIKCFDKVYLKKMIGYAVPLVPNQISIWVMNSSDRLIVTFVLGVSANGILAVTHKFPAICLTFFNIFLLAWHETGAVHYFDEDRDVFFTDMFKKTFSFFSTLCMLSIAVLPIVFDWFVNEKYHEAYYNIPIYLVAALFNVVVGLLGVVYVATKKTAEIAKTTMLAAVINIIVHYAFINFMGLYAASISTFVGYGITMILRIVDTKKYIKIKYDIKHFMTIGSVLCICLGIYYLENKIVSILFLPVFILASYYLNKDIVNNSICIIHQRIEEKITKRLFILILVVITIIMATVGGLFVYIKVKTFPKEIQMECKEDILDIKTEKIIRFSDFGSENFTCTGLSYDRIDDAFWIGDYGSMNPDEYTNPRVIEVDRNFKTILRTIDLSDVLDSSTNLQGVAFDRVENCLWLAVGDSVVKLSKEGGIAGIIDLEKYSKYKANGICYDDSDDSLWILCASRYLLHYDKENKTWREYQFNYTDQDHICIESGYLYATVGADYQGDNNFICKVSLNNGEIMNVYRTLGANALEGICFVDKKLMIVNDGLYHTDLIGESYIAIFDDIEGLLVQQIQE